MIPASWTIFTWWSETAPSNSKGLARIQIPGHKGAADWNAVIFHAPSEDEAKARAVAWIEAEVAKAEAKANRPKKGGRPKKSAEPVDELPPEAL